MRFYTRTTVYDQIGKGEGRTPREFYSPLIRLAHQIMSNQARIELGWIEEGRPYYNVWPAIIPALLKLTLDIQATEIQPPEQVLVIKLPEERNLLRFEYHGEEHEVQSIMVTGFHVLDNSGDVGISLWIDIGEEVSGMRDYTFRNIPFRKGKTLEQCFDTLPVSPSALDGIQIPSQCLANCVKLVVSLLLLERDPEIIIPDVLNKDKDKLVDSGRWAELQDRAKRRGKFGWNIGETLDVSPGVVVPAHMCHFYVGKGRTERIYKIRKGWIVHRDVVTKLPTGYEDLTDAEKKNENEQDTSDS